MLLEKKENFRGFRVFWFCPTLKIENLETSKSVLISHILAVVVT